MDRNKAIEVLKDFWSVYEIGTEIREAFETLIPELKESEDERIRKHIIEVLKDHFSGKDTDKCIAWLERQGEKNGALDYMIEQSRDNWEFVHEFVEKFGRIPKDEDELNVLVEYVSKRQKPNTWSEEDERHMNTIVSVIRGGTHYAYENELNWLKSLEDRYTWKPSDKQMKQLGLVVELNKDTLIGEGLMTLFNDLKKLRR